jgi:hypothetical protein
VLSCCLLPYLISSIYSIVSSILQVPSPSTWLWGDWLNTLVDSNSGLYMVLAEGPVCCVGTVALLIVILGAVAMITGLEPRDEEVEVGEEYDSAQEYPAGEEYNLVPTTKEWGDEL